MKLDDMLRNVKRFDPPETLRERVMAQARAHRSEQASWLAAIGRLKSRPAFRATVALGACAAALLLLVDSGRFKFAVPAPSTTDASYHLAYNEMDLFLEQTLGMVYEFKSMESSAEYQVDEDAARFINNQIEKIYRINGGNNA